jgi:phage shock protein C
MDLDDTTPPAPRPERPPLALSSTDRLVAGVCGGLAAYTGVDTTLVRLAVAVLALFGGTGVALYIVAWIVMPQPGGEPPLAQRWFSR